MSKVLLIPLIILLCSCVLVGANNSINGTDNRVFTLFEFIELTNSTFSGFTFTQEIIDGWFDDKEEFDNSSDSFGSESFVADTGASWVDELLNALSKLCSPIIMVFRAIFLVLGFIIGVLGDLLRVILSFGDLLIKFLFGYAVSA